MYPKFIKMIFDKNPYEAEMEAWAQETRARLYQQKRETMKNYICINGKKIELSEETLKNIEQGLEDDLPKSWEEAVKSIKETYYITPKGDVSPNSIILKDVYDLAAKELAEAHVALSKLTTLCYVWNGGEIPIEGYTIYKDYRGYVFAGGKDKCAALRFNTEELRDKFYNQFKDLLETAKPLL